MSPVLDFKGAECEPSHTLVHHVEHGTDTTPRSRLIIVKEVWTVPWRRVLIVVPQCYGQKKHI